MVLYVCPTDTAFDQVQGIVGQVDEQKLLEIHILPEPRLTFDLRCGQTYRTINTSNNRKNRQRVKVRCLTASTAEVLGPGNYKVGKRPVIGSPERVFNGWEFSGQNSFTNLNVQAFSGSNNNNNAGLSASEDNNGETTFGFSENVISCNGVIQVVNHVILPGNTNTNVYQGYYGAPNTQSMFRSGGSRKPRGRVGYYGPVGKGMGKGIGKGMGKGGIARGKGTVIAYGYYGGKGKKGHKGHKGHKGYYGHKGKKSHKGSKGHYYGGYYSSYGKGIGKGTGKGTGKGMGKGTGKGMGGYYGSRNYYGGGYYSGRAYYGGASVGVAYATTGAYYGYRRNLKEGEEAEDNFLSPDFEEENFYGERDLESEDDYDYYHDDEMEEEDYLDHVSRRGAQQEDADAMNTEDAEALAAATEEKYKNRKRKLEALLEPDGTIV